MICRHGERCRGDQGTRNRNCYVFASQAPKGGQVSTCHCIQIPSYVVASKSLRLLMLHSRYFGTERLPDGNIRIFLEYLPGGSLQQVTRELQHRDDDGDGDVNGGGGGNDDDDLQPSCWLTCETDASAIWPLGRGSGATHYAASIGRHTGIFKLLQFVTVSSRSHVTACSTSTARTSATATSKPPTSCARTSPASSSLTLERPS